jgi:acyl-CoA oxidase
MSTISDGRNTRWDPHRAQRRRDLVEDTLRAIRAHGPSVGMDEIASMANTSKTVIYRHFGDRLGLYSAVVDSTMDYILRNLREAMADADSDLLDVVSQMTDAYLKLVERDPEIYFFVLSRPIDPDSRDAVEGLTTRIGDELAVTIAAQLAAAGLPAEPAATWGHGIVGFIRAATDHWAATGRARPRSDVVADVVALFRTAFVGLDA